MSREIDRARKAPVTMDRQEERGLTTPPTLFSNLGDMFSFRYSCTEIYSENDGLHVKRKETRYQNGRITSEECEGTVDRQAVDHFMEETQAYFLNQAAGFMRMLYSPFFSRGRREGE